jgi:hypothetical protein
MAQNNNQEIRISVTMQTQSVNGINWEGTVELTSFGDDNEVIEKVSDLSNQLVARALQEQSHIGRCEDIAEGVAAAPKRARRAKMQPQAEAVEVGSMQTLGDPRRVDIGESSPAINATVLDDDDLPF